MLTPKEFNMLRVMFNNMMVFQTTGPTGMPCQNINREAVIEVLEKFTEFEPPTHPKDVHDFKKELSTV